jgi:hypothetical protein
MLIARMPVALRIHVSRGEDNRLSGTVATTDDVEVRSFSGTLELMRVFEELVPVEGETVEADASHAQR